MKGAVSFLVVLEVLGLIAVSILCIVGVTNGSMSVILFVAIEFAMILSSVPIFALNNALGRIENLEAILKKKKVIKDSDLDEIETDEREEVTFCKKCGYQIFEEDLECPNCKTKIK